MKTNAIGVFSAVYYGAEDGFRLLRSRAESPRIVSRWLQQGTLHFD
jgi:hypothetical protein